MQINAIVAMSENHVIGNKNQLPWHLPADLQHFKTITFGKPILMGRKTFQSIGRPLPGRKNIILTTDKNFTAEGCDVAHSIAEALKIVEDQTEIFIIGGANLYATMLPQVQKLYLTIINQQFSGDAFFPELNMSEWREISREDHLPDEKNQYAFSFLVLERKQD